MIVRLRRVLRFPPSAGGASGRARPVSLLAAASLVALQALTLVVIGGYLTLVGLLGHPQNTLNAVLLGVIAAGSGVGLGVLGAHLGGGRRWARTPILVWSLITLLVGFGQSGANRVLGLALVATAGLTILLCVVPASNAALRD